MDQRRHVEPTERAHRALPGWPYSCPRPNQSDLMSRRFVSVSLGYCGNWVVLSEGTVANIGAGDNNLFQLGMCSGLLSLNEHGKCERSNKTGMDQMTQLPAPGEVQHFYLQFWPHCKVDGAFIIF